MANKTFKIFTDKMGGTNLTSFIGSSGDLVYDPTIPVIKMSDGTTVGGINLSFTQISPVYGQVSSNTTQIPANTNAYVITFDINDALSGIDHIIGDTKIRALFDGVYYILFGCQVDRGSGSGSLQFDCWLRKNGVNVPGSTVRLSLDTSRTDVIIGNYVMPLLANDYIEVIQAVETADVGFGITRYDALAGGPIVPSIIFSIAKVSG